MAEFTASTSKRRDGELYIAGSKSPLDVRWSRELSSAPSITTVSRDSTSRYFVSCLCEFEPVSIPVIAEMVGIDVSLKGLFITDTGFKIDNPCHIAKYAKRLTLLQRCLSREQKDPGNRIKARLKVARLRAKTADCRMDSLHKLSRKLINENQVACVESLKVKNMIRNPRLPRVIVDTGWNEPVCQFQYGSKQAGRSVIAIGQYLPSSGYCSCYGFTTQKMPLSVRKWHYPECGADYNHDINTTRNIKAVGLAVLTHRESINPKSQHAAQIRLTEVGIPVAQGGEPSRALLSYLQKMQPETLVLTSRY